MADGNKDSSRQTSSQTCAEMQSRHRCQDAEMRGRLRGRATSRWTRAEEQPSGARGPPAAFSLPLPSPALAVNASGGRFPAQTALYGSVPALLLLARTRGRFPRGRSHFGALPPRIRVWRPRQGCRRPPDAILRLGDA